MRRHKLFWAWLTPNQALFKGKRESLNLGKKVFKLKGRVSKPKGMVSKREYELSKRVSERVQIERENLWVETESPFWENQLRKAVAKTKRQGVVEEDTYLPDLLK